MTYKNIMLAIDGSNVSNAAVEEINRLTKGKRIHLRVVHVVDEKMVYCGGPGFDHSLIINSLKEEGAEVLESAVKIIEKQSAIKVEKFLLELKVFRETIADMIVAEAADWPADLLVIGSHGRRGFSHFFLGSVAEQVVRNATIPVLIVRSSNELKQ
ncbi:universal stress protein A [Legionella antarctica]|uniref:Universal stress protein A n=1 Tax=Legionella antarctica TaxID=2708020 RepID=A0A6F8T9B8_9GAMM|nr:universal stress protein [Legionella antarctica]BCA96576.1 universal stress protein A [Legionella antarctica]